MPRAGPRLAEYARSGHRRDDKRASLVISRLHSAEETQPGVRGDRVNEMVSEVTPRHRWRFITCRSISAGLGIPPVRGDRAAATVV
jgi:hypothetical protein